MRITKVYTRTGDGGQTRLVGGQKVDKDDIRIDSYGTVDELNAVVGLVRTFVAAAPTAAAAPPPAQAAAARLDPMLHRVQNDLFNVGADLATLPGDRWKGMVLVREVDIKRLEDWIDELNADLPALTEFILPGGGPAGAFFHQARTVCRRAERRLVSLMKIESGGKLGGVLGGEQRTADDQQAVTLRYLNRLSDWLFVAGRWAAQAQQEPEFLWERPRLA